MLAIILCGAFLINAAQSQQTPAPSALQLDRVCQLRYLIPSSPCTCSKTDPKTEGTVQWTFLNGTLANQTTDPQTGASTLIVESPYTYALNQSYICQNVASGSKINYTAHFMFGPESARLRWAEEPKEQIYLCPSNETKELKMVCEVPSQSVNPQPIFTALINGNRYGAYDRLPGRLNEEEKVWRLELNFKLNRAGNNTIFCHARNEYYAANWFTLQQTVFVSDQAPASFKC